VLVLENASDMMPSKTTRRGLMLSLKRGDFANAFGEVRGAREHCPGQ
jgi:hypothetical protein